MAAISSRDLSFALRPAKTATPPSNISSEPANLIPISLAHDGLGACLVNRPQGAGWC